VRVAWIVPLVALAAGCPTVDLGDTPSDIGTCYPNKGEPYFETVIWPSYINNTKRSCVTGNCHEENSTGGGALHFTTMPPNLVENYRRAQFELKCQFPEAGFLYAKPCGIEPHKGTQIFTCPTDQEAQLFLAWFK
jgi:hypothetical protein